MRRQPDHNGAPPAGDKLVEGEFHFTEEDFRRISAMLHADAGIALPESKATLVYSRLAKRLRTLGLSSFRDYCALIAGSDGVDERQKMMAALTTNVTRFFREPHHFDHLQSKVLPALVAEAKRGGRVRIWSAGCSNGQEAYSAAMTILSVMPDAADYDIRILASDIDPNMVAEGKAGIYRDDVVAVIPENVRARWMTPSRKGSGWMAGDAMRRLVSFRELNLIADWPVKGPFQVIFCRNTVIYFEEETQSRIWTRFAPLLAPRGVLYIGHSERLTGPAVARFENDGLTTYRLKEGRA